MPPRVKSEQGRDRRARKESAVQAEAGRRAELVEGEAGEDRADDAREVELDRVQGDGLRQILAVDERRKSAWKAGPPKDCARPDDEGERRMIQT